MKLILLKAMKKSSMKELLNDFLIICCSVFITNCGTTESKLSKNINNLSSQKYEVREKAAKTLGEMRDSIAVDPLIKALNDEDYGVRKAAAVALGKIGSAKAVEPLIGRLYDKDPDVAKAALHALVNIGEPAIDPLAQLLRISTIPIKIFAVNALGSIENERVIEPLISASRDSDPKVRKAVVTALAKHKDKRATETISNMINDEDSDVANAATQALSNYGTQDLRRVRRLLRPRY